MRVAKTKALISFAVTAKLICAFVFANADCWFSQFGLLVFSIILIYLRPSNFFHHICMLWCAPDIMKS